MTTLTTTTKEHAHVFVVVELVQIFDRLSVELARKFAEFVRELFAGLERRVRVLADGGGRLPLAGSGGGAAGPGGTGGRRLGVVLALPGQLVGCLLFLGGDALADLLQ